MKAMLKKIAGRLDRAGFPSEARKYSPHVTLAYMRGASKTKDTKLVPWLESTAPFLAAPFEAPLFTLIESRLGTGGSHYVDLEDYPLRPE